MARRAPNEPPSTALGFIELASERPAETRRFLEAAFGWTFQERPMPRGTYLAFAVPGGGTGGIRPTQPTESPSTISYVRVPNLEAARTRVEAAGGTVVLPRVDVPGMGSFFWFQVPGGPVLACWQDAPPGTGSRA